MQKNWRIGVIGSTGRGDYGHGLDTAFRDVPQATIVAVADDSQSGLMRSASRLGVNATYADYRRMLDAERLDIVCVGPRWLDDRLPMIAAAAQHGCHVYCEKPLAWDLGIADAIQKLLSDAGLKLSLAHQWRAMPPVQKAIRDVRTGKYGQLLRMWARPKDDRRGGGEELLIHGTHWFDLMFAFAGPPRWVSGHISVGDRDARLDDRRAGSEPVGPIAGDSISATFGFDHGTRGFFDSTAHLAPAPDGRYQDVYGLTVECERALLALRQPGDVYVYPAPRVLPDLESLRWEKQWIEEWHFTQEHKPRNIRSEWLHLGNTVLAADLIDAIEKRRDPLSPLQHGVWVTEMVQGVYESHFAEGRRLPIPLSSRRHPLRA